MKESKLKTLIDNEESIDLSLSYSRVSDFDRNGPIALDKRTHVENEGIKHGSLVDILLTDKMTNKKEFDKQYVVADITKPTATLGLLSDIILNNYLEIPSKEIIFKIIAKNNFWSRTKNIDLLNQEFDKPEFWEYLKIKIETKDKIVITKEEYYKAKESVVNLLNNKFTHYLFYNDLDNHYQVKFEFKYKYFIFRGILDKLTIDHKNKIVYMEDIKTGEPKADKFIESFIKYRYYFQEAVYVKAFDKIKEMFNLSNEYKLAPFKFIYLCKTEDTPLVYVVTLEWSKAALNGFKTTNGYTYKGLDENIERIYYHWKNKHFKFSKEIYENNGIINLNDDFIITNE
jgi:hypothetical protein